MPKIWVSLNQEYPKTAFYEGNYVQSARVVEKSVRLCVVIRFTSIYVQSNCSRGLVKCDGQPFCYLPSREFFLVGLYPMIPSDLQETEIHPSSQKVVCCVLQDFTSLSTLNHLIVIGKYFLYKRAFNNSRFLFADFIAVLREKIDV